MDGDDDDDACFDHFIINDCCSSLRSYYYDSLMLMVLGMMIMNVKLQLCSIQQVYGISVVQHAVNTLRSIGYSGSFNGISVNSSVTDAVLTCMLNLHTCMH